MDWNKHCGSRGITWVEFVVKLAPKIEKKRYQRLRNKPLRGGNLQYITRMENYWMIQITKPPFYI